MIITVQYALFAVLLIGGMLLVGAAFSAPILPGVVFVAGIICFSLAFIIPMMNARHDMR